MKKHNVILRIAIIGSLIATFGVGGLVFLKSGQQPAYAKTFNPYLPVISGQTNVIQQSGSKYEIVTGKGSKIIIGDASTSQFKPPVEFPHFANEAGIKL